MNMRWLALAMMLLMALFLPLLLADSSAGSDQELTKEQAQVLVDGAREVCEIPRERGESKGGRLSGSVRASLSNLFKKLADLGMESAGEYDWNTYDGLPQQDLLEARRDTHNCRIAALKILKERAQNLPKSPSKSKPPQKPTSKPLRLPYAKLGINSIEATEDGLVVNFFLSHSSPNLPAYFSEIRAVSMCPSEDLSRCKKDSKWFGRRDAAHVPYAALSDITISDIYSNTGDVLKSKYVEIPPHVTEGYKFTITQGAHNSFIAKIIFKYKIGMEPGNGESDEIIAVRYSNKVLTPTNADKYPEFSYILTSNMEEARTFIVDIDRYIKVYKGGRINM